MYRWHTIAQIAKRDGITTNAARKRAARYVRVGMWERRKALKKGRFVVEFRDWDMSWPKHNGSE